MSPFPLNIGISIRCRQADGICSVFMMQLNNLHRIFIPKLPIHFHASAGISSAPTAFPLFIPLRAVSVSSSLVFSVIAWLGVSFFCSNSLVFLIHQQVKVLAPSLLDFIILHQNVSCCTFDIAYLAYVLAWSVPCSCNSIYVLLPSTVSSWSYSPSIASAFTLATTIFAFPFAVLYSTLSFSSPVLFQIFSLSFFSLTALSVSSLHHQRSSPVFFLPVDPPHRSSPHFLICWAISSHHCSTFSVVASSMFDSLSTRFLRNFSFVSSCLSFHHLYRFLPAALLCLVLWIWKWNCLIRTVHLCRAYTAQLDTWWNHTIPFID